MTSEKIKITENNLLWKLYKRSSKNQPTNVCQLFWGAVDGLLIKIFHDWNYCIIATLIITAIITISYIAIPWLSVIVAILFLFLVFLTLLRIALWVEKEKWRQIFSYIIIASTTIIAFSYLLYNKPPKSLAFMDVLICAGGMIAAIFAILVALTVFITLYNKISTKETFKTISIFLVAQKKKVCPLIETPKEKSK